MKYLKMQKFLNNFIVFKIFIFFPFSSAWYLISFIKLTNSWLNWCIDPITVGRCHCWWVPILRWFDDPWHLLVVHLPRGSTSGLFMGDKAAKPWKPEEPLFSHMIPNFQVCWVFGSLPTSLCAIFCVFSFFFFFFFFFFQLMISHV